MPNRTCSMREPGKVARQARSLSHDLREMILNRTTRAEGGLSSILGFGGATNRDLLCVVTVGGRWEPIFGLSRFLSAPGLGAAQDIRIYGCEHSNLALRRGV